MIQLQDFSEAEPLQPTEIDLAVYTMRNIFKNNLTWLSHAYGRAYRYKPEDLDGRNMPFVYAGNTDGKYSLMNVAPDNDKSGTLFFVVGKERPLNYNQNLQGFMNWNVGIVFWANLELINKELSNTEDFTQTLVKEVRKVIRDNFLGIGFAFDLQEITRDFFEVFAEFDIKDKKAGIMPFSCFRINAILTIKEECI
jgi:hypothetical protein